MSLWQKQTIIQIRNAQFVKETGTSGGADRENILKMLVQCSRPVFGTAHYLGRRNWSKSCLLEASAYFKDLTCNLSFTTIYRRIWFSYNKMLSIFVMRVKWKRKIYKWTSSVKVSNHRHPISLHITAVNKYFDWYSICDTDWINFLAYKGGGRRTGRKGATSSQGVAKVAI